MPIGGRDFGFFYLLESLLLEPCRRIHSGGRYIKNSKVSVRGVIMGQTWECCMSLSFIFHWSVFIPTKLQKHLENSIQCVSGNGGNRQRYSWILTVCHHQPFWSLNIFCSLLLIHKPHSYPCKTKQLLHPV